MIRVLVAEASGVIRGRLREMFAADSEIAVIGEATDGPGAIAMTRLHRPDVVVVDIDIPGMGGFGVTKQIMIETPTPIVILSVAQSAREAEISMLALRAGALAVLSKPIDPDATTERDARQRFVGTVKAMSQVKLVRHWGRREPNGAIRSIADAPGVAAAKVVAIAASTGGPTAIQSILSQLPTQFPAPILVVQHIAGGFIGGFTAWLNTVCSLTVKVAQHGESLAPQTVYVAPDEHHLGLASERTLRLSNGPPIGGFRPSANFLFESAANVAGRDVLAIMLTGMGRDGVEGLQAVHDRGGRIIAQDESTSVVFGMPQAAIAAGYVDAVLPLAAIAPRILELVQR